MIPASGAGGRGFDSPNSPEISFCFEVTHRVRACGLLRDCCHHSGFEGSDGLYSCLHRLQSKLARAT